MLDAKYKRLGSYEKVSKVDRNDVHQVITYMQRLKAPRGGFVSPLESKQIKVPSSSIIGHGGTLSIYGIEINKSATSYGDFCKNMAINEDTFIRLIT